MKQDHKTMTGFIINYLKKVYYYRVYHTFQRQSKTMKKLLVITTILIPVFSFCQSLSPGISAGIIPPVFSKFYPFAGVNLEYGIRNSDLSLNTGMDIFPAYDETIVSVPLYIKASTAGKIKFCPFVGGFANTDARFGWMLGAGVEYGQKDKINLFLQGEIYVGYYKETQSENIGIQDFYWSKYAISQLRIGVKKNIPGSGRN
jgi:hypothetical protein